MFSLYASECSKRVLPTHSVTSFQNHELVVKATNQDMCSDEFVKKCNLLLTSSQQTTISAFTELGIHHRVLSENNEKLKQSLDSVSNLTATVSFPRLLVKDVNELWLQNRSTLEELLTQIEDLKEYLPGVRVCLKNKAESMKLLYHRKRATEERLRETQLRRREVGRNFHSESFL